MHRSLIYKFNLYFVSIYFLWLESIIYLGAVPRMGR